VIAMFSAANVGTAVTKQMMRPTGFFGGDQEGVLRLWDVTTAKVMAEFKP